MKYKIVLLPLIVLFIFSVVSCNKGVEKQTDDSDLDQPATEEVELMLDEPEVTLETLKAEFEGMKKPPILNFYTAVIDGQEVQVRECTLFSGEASLDYIFVDMMTTGDNPSDSPIINDSIVVKNGIKYLIHKSQKYPLTIDQSLNFDLYCNLDFKITKVNPAKLLEEDDYWHEYVTATDFHQSFIPKAKTDLYSKVFASDAFLDLTLGESRDDLKKWGYRMTCDTVVSEEALFVEWDYTSIRPARYDSVVFVVQTLNDMYMGGAHGMHSSDTHNFDVKTGKLIDLTDVINTSSAVYTDLLKSKINEIYDFAEYNVDEEQPSSFMLYANGIELTFPPYSLGGGFWEKSIFLTYQELDGVLKKQYYPVEK